AELSDVDNAASLSAACGGQVHPLVPQQSTARITVSTLREPGLTQVVEELLDFRGCDIYLRPVGSLAGSSFGEVIHAFAKARPIGRMGREGELELNPPPQTVLVEGDRLIVLADDESAALRPAQSDVRRAIPTKPVAPLAAGIRREQLVVIGWSPLGARLIDQLAHVVASGSSVEVVYDARLFEPDELPVVASEKMAVTLTPTKADVWLPDEDRLSTITSIVVLGYRRGTAVEEADSRTLLNIMLLRQGIERRGGVGPRIVAELLNADNVDLARMTGADDFLVSDAIASRFIAQLAEQPERRDILLSLYAPDGPSVHLLYARDLGVVGQRGWDDVTDAVYAEGLLAIGWRRTSVDGGQVVLNPESSADVMLAADDHVVVVG
ncbi:MAG: hypothetical protein OEV40_31310, partial [Acidimicrobiia bacterium]|nr:hypothetical protein [Acidimicrobiia bacterium]